MPIKRELTRIVLLTCAPVLILACIAIAAYELHDYRRAMARDMTILADVLAKNTRAAITFQDDAAARAILQALQAEPQVAAACLYGKNGARFAEYSRGNLRSNFPESPGDQGAKFDQGHLKVFRPILLDAKPIGTIYIEADLTGIFDREKVFAGISALVIVGAMLIALALAAKLQRPITEPILALAETARSIAGRKDYSVRAAPQNQKEIGILTEAFNQMLDGIQEAESRLREAMTREKELRVQAQSSEDRFRTLVEQSLVGIYVIQDGKFVYVNPTLEKILGFSAAEISARPVLDFVLTEDRPVVQENIRKRVEGEVSELHYGLRMVRSDGNTAIVEVRGGRSEFGGRPAILGTLLDITERKQAEQKILLLNLELEERVRDRTARLEEANKELESFSYSVSHDLRAPLRHIHGYVEMLKRATEGQLSEKAQRYLQTITSASAEMAQLIDDLLAFSRTSRTELREKRVSLDDLLQETIRGLEMSLQGRNITWKIQELPCVSADPSTLKQVFANLVGNAVKYTRTRETAHIEIGVQGEQDGRFVLFIRDNGAGFDMQYAHKLFGVFQRLHRSEEFEGTGIGLATVHRIIQRHGGRIWAEGAVDQGATFYLTLKKC